MVKNFRQGSGLSINTLKKRVQKKSKTYLVPIDGSINSFRVLQYAIRRAEDFSHRIVVLYVIPKIDNVENNKIKTSLRKQGEKFLKKAKKHCASYNISFSSKMVSGNPGKEIVRFANKNKIDEIIIGHGNKKSGAFMGSASNYVVNKTKLPITLIK